MIEKIMGIYFLYEIFSFRQILKLTRSALCFLYHHVIFSYFSK